jgi:accessory colonization factor AcfC
MNDPDLHVYSAGAVAPPLQEAIAYFERKSGTIIRLTAGKPENLLKSIALRKSGDVISCGAEYVHDEAEDRDLLIKGTRKSLGYRRSVIITKEGNPKGILGLSDLCRQYTRIGTATGGCLKGIWDDICSKAGIIEQIRPNITEHADACGSLMALIHQDKVDAVFGWNAFKNIWPDTCEAVELPRDLQVYRSTAAQVVTYTKNRSLAEELVGFLVSPEGRRIYSSYGWLHYTGSP